MKLYYSPGACSLSPHITLHESGLKFDHVLAPTKTHKLADGTDYYTINPERNSRGTGKRGRTGGRRERNNNRTQA